MDILFLTRSLDYGGAERQLVALARGLRERGHTVTVAVFYAGGPLETGLSEGDVTVVPLNKGGRWDIIPFLLRLLKLLYRKRPDLIHGYLPISNLLTVLLKPFFPHVRMIWGVRASNVDLTRYDSLSRLVFRLECLFSRYADLIIYNSLAGRDYHICHGFPSDKMVVIPNGIDTDHFRPDPEAGKVVRDEWGIGIDEKMIGIIARLDPMKDHPTFLRAAALLSQQRPDVRFVCVGEGPEPYRSELHALATSLGLGGRLVWAGSRRDMVAVYNALDVASLSSAFGEGFPNVVAEAMSCGTPCVVTDVGDATWVTGAAAPAIPIGDHQSLAAEWTRMLDNTEGSALRNRIIENFSLEKLLSETEKILWPTV